eukprot:gene12417-12504_t
MFERKAEQVGFGSCLMAWSAVYKARGSPNHHPDHSHPEFFMRIVFATLLAAGLAGCSSEPAKAPVQTLTARPKPPSVAAVNAPVCGKPAEKAALAVAALRMQLSVTELSCDGREKFNAFTVKFRNDVSAQNKTVGSFFSRAYGRRGQSQQDEYETSQINAMSQAGTYYGTDFCKTAMPMFDEVLALKNGTELANYAVAKNFDQVLTVADCAAPTPPPAKAPAPSKAQTKPAAKG